MMAWIEFISAGLFFLITHRVPTIPQIRSNIVDVIGERGFLIAYSILSLTVLVWLIVAAAHAPYIEVWPSSPWQYWAPNIAMPLVCTIIAFSIASPNPLSFGGSNPDEFNPKQPGFAGVMRHGLLWALALWSGSHMIPNGNLAHVILFGGFCIFSLYGMRILDRRRQQLLGIDEWESLSKATSTWPFQSLIQKRWKPSLSGVWQSIIVRMLIAILLYLALLMLHSDVIGVNPLPIIETS